MDQTEVLIAGAGPTGLVLAIWLTKIGVKVRIIDKTEKAGTTSRATIFHAKNLEFYYQMGFADIPVKEGMEVKGVQLWKRGKKAGHAQISDLRMEISPYQYVLAFTQDKQEAMLQEQLALLGIHVERTTELLSFEQSGKGIIAQLRKGDGTQEQCEALYIAGCDGAHSVVRQQLITGFPGGTYEETFYVADIKCKGTFSQDDINIALDDADFLAIFPLRGADEVRLVGAIRPDAMNKEHLQWDDVSGAIIEHLKIDVLQVNWFSTYKVHHRVAAHFRKGNAFLLGDAGHLHSPIGGQGMNTGIGDAVNLAWKLGAVIKDKAPVALLDTYEPERIAFARRLVASTDRAFTFVTKRSPLATWVRMNIAPVVIPWLFEFVSVRRLLFRTVSQTNISYRQSALSRGRAGKIKSGDRLPWVKSQDNFASLTSMAWQLHCYGMLSPGINNLCTAKNIPVHIFPWTADARTAGLKQNAVYIIRPDGYVGIADEKGDLGKVTAYLKEWGIGVEK